MFDHMNAELANQHRNNIVKDADNYRKMVAAEGNQKAPSQKTKRTAGVLAGIVNWLDVQIVKRFGSLFHPRTSH